MKTFLHDPDAKLTYGFDWSDWLDGETIASSTWIVPTGITATGENNTDSETSVMISGVTAKASFVITNRITSSTGEIEDRSFIIKGMER